MQKNDGPYTQRIQRVFQRIQNIMANNQGQRSDKIRQIVTLIRQHQKLVQEQQEDKLQLFETIFERISGVQKRSIEQSNKREKNISSLQQSLMKAQKKCKNAISSNIKERQEMERKFRQRIDGIFNKQKNLLQQVIGHANDNLAELASCEQKLPALGQQLTYESQLRSQIESKIYEQFLQQIAELKRLFQNQRSQRIHDHEQTLVTLKLVYTKICDKIKHQQSIRQRNQSLVLKVVEQLVNQISSSYNSL